MLRKNKTLSSAGYFRSKSKQKAAVSTLSPQEHRPVFLIILLYILLRGTGPLIYSVRRDGEYWLINTHTPSIDVLAHSLLGWGLVLTPFIYLPPVPQLIGPPSRMSKQLFCYNHNEPLHNACDVTGMSQECCFSIIMTRVLKTIKLVASDIPL